MIEIDIPGHGALHLEHLVLDVNGTLAKDGNLIEGIQDLLAEIAKRLQIHLITADTHGRQETINRQLNLRAALIPESKQDEAKLDYVTRLGMNQVVAVGNGANDALMLRHATLGICVIGPEGAAGVSIQNADVVVCDIKAALELLLNPKRLVATLRR